MSQSPLAIRPSFPVFSSADFADNDTYGLDCRQSMTLRGDHIVSALLVGVTRADNVAMTSSDLQVSLVNVVPAGSVVYLRSGPLIAPLGMFVSWQATGGLQGACYWIKLALTLASGNVINRTCSVDVPPYVG
jgi:hypothetical protein